MLRRRLWYHRGVSEEDPLAGAAARATSAEALKEAAAEDTQTRALERAVSSMALDKSVATEEAQTV